MQPSRRKPRVNHVRTGCLTCKRRRVKCPEERPYCSRCIRGGFICAGYAVPKAWIFESSAEAQRKVGEERSESSTSSPYPDSDAQTPTASQTTHSLFDISSPPPLPLGNSEPLDSYAIPIGPYETYLFQVYQQLTFPQLYNLKQPKWRDFVAGEITRIHASCLQDEAAAYSLLARNAAIEHVIVKRLDPATSTPLLDYTTKAQAALHRRLTLMDGSETPQTVYAIMWTTCFLASTDMIVNSPTTDFHFSALSKLIVRYVELVGKDVERGGSILTLVYLILMRATTTLTRPVLDMALWFPRIFQDAWSVAEALWPTRAISSSATAIHRDVEDEVIREIMTSQRHGSNFCPDHIETCHDEGEIQLLSNTMRSQELYRHGQMLNVATDALTELDTADLASERVQDQSARAYISMSTIVWLRLTSTTTYFSNAIFDAAGSVLPHLRTVFMNLEKRSCNCDQTRYRESQLWALFMAVQNEYHRKYVLGVDPVCGEWFMETFRHHVATMEIQSWQQAVGMFEQFLYNDELTPHISEWWQHMFPNGI